MKFSCCAWVGMLKFCHLKILSGAVNARKWSAKWRNWKIWHIILYEFNRRTKAAEAARNICVMYGDNAIGESTARKWFSCFKEDCFDISDTPRSGKPSECDQDRLNTLIHNDPRQCTRELANVMNCDHSTIVRHFHSMGKVQKSDVWIPPKPQKSASGHKCISGCSSSIASWTTSTISILFRYLWREMVSICLLKENQAEY